MTTREKLVFEIARLRKEEEEIIELANKTKSIDFIISLGKQALKNQEKISFASSMLRSK